MNSVLKKLVWVLIGAFLILSLLLTGVGGLLDMFGWDKLLLFTKEHAWHDGLYLLILTGVLLLFLQTS